MSGEQSKFGFSVWDQSLWPIFIEEIKGIMDLNHLRVSGLMTMAPFFDDPELARPYFRRLRELRDFLSTKIPEDSCEHLSMGMSGDFQVAVQEGATYLQDRDSNYGSTSSTTNRSIVMVLIGNLFHFVIQIFILLVIIQAVLSFVMDPYHPVRRRIDQIVDPFLQPIRNVVPPIANLDFSPLILIILLQLVDRYIVRLFY